MSYGPSNMQGEKQAKDGDEKQRHSAEVALVLVLREDQAIEVGHRHAATAIALFVEVGQVPVRALAARVATPEASAQKGDCDPGDLSV